MRKTGHYDVILNFKTTYTPRYEVQNGHVA